MKTIAFFNNKGGVGKTSLVYHLAWMFAELGQRVIAADFDPQANLTRMCISEERLEEIWRSKLRPTVFSAIAPLKRGMGDLGDLHIENVATNFSLIPGDLALSGFEDDLSLNWTKCLAGDERAFRVTAAFARLIQNAGTMFHADIGLIDVGPNLGATNRAALIAADYVLIPAAPDLFSVQGLENVGPCLIAWRQEWRDSLARAPKEIDFELPKGQMSPIGYVVSRYSVFENRQAKAYRKWLERIPGSYREKVLNKTEAPGDPSIDSDQNCLAQLKDYRSLMPMAQEARKPMFKLKPADGAIGGHQGAVQSCYGDFKKLCGRIAKAIELKI